MVSRMIDTDILLRGSDAFLQEAVDSHAQARSDETIEELHRCADAYFENGNLSSARSCYMQAVELTENNQSWPYIGLGVIALEQDQIEEAHAAFVSASQCDGDCTEAYYGLAKVYQLQGMLKHAAFMYVNVLDNAPDNLIAIAGLFQVCRQTGEYAKIIGYLRDYLKRNPDDTTIMFCLATLYAKANRSHTAMVLLERIMELDPNCRDAAVLLENIILSIS